MLNHYSKNVPFVFRQKKNLFLIQLIFVLILSTSLFGQTRFITTWDTTNPGTSNSTSITIPTIGAGYNYDVDWNSDGTFDEFGITGDVTHDFGAPGIYTIRIRGSFPRIYFNNSGDKDKIITIARWGAMSWTSMENAFYGCSNLIINTAAPDAPDLSLVTSMSGMFRDATNVNGAAAHWDVSNITDMSNLFRNALNFNQNLSAWNVSNVTNMSNMFNSNTNFNTNLSAWDVSNVTNMTDMLLDTALTTNSYDALLLAWNNLTLQSGVNFNAGLSNYCAGTAARNNMISNFGWSIIDNGSAGSPVTAICRTTPFNLLLDATGNAILDPSDIDNGSTVNCGGTLSLSVSQTNFSCADLGTNTILLTANDGNGNISTCTTTVEVISNIPPTPNTTILPNITAQCEVTTLDIPTATNTCGIVISGTHNTTFPITTIGTTIVTWTYDDGNGNVSTQDQNVIITDNIAPVTPTLTALTTDCNGTLTAPATTDVCAGIITGTTSDTLNFVEGGSTTITWTFDDGNGNTTTANQIYNYDDSTAPVTPTLPALTVSCNETLTVPTTTDNCSGTIIGTTSDTLNFIEGGSTTITWTFNDGNGNTTTANQVYNYDDTTAPVSPTLPALTVDCNGTLTVPTTTDNCSGINTGTTTDTLNFIEGGSTTITWTFDDGNGNTTTANQVYNYDDTTAPVTPALASLTVDCNGTLAAPTTTDICAGNITGTTTDTLNFVEGGSTTITWTFDDGNGNTTTASQVYNYDDTTAPVTPTLPDLNAQCSITPIAPTTTDNCEGTITGTTSSTFPITTQGTTIVTWNFDDGNGNSINVNQNVIINDTTPPTAICQNITITIDASGSTSISESDIDNGSFDNCGIAAMTLDTLNFDCSNLGANTVTLTVRDNANNISTCTATVTVEDPAQNASVNISVNTNEICENENVIFTAAPVNGGTVPIYEWFINGVSFGTNSDTFIPFTALNNGDDVYVLMQSSLSSCIIPKQSNTITMIVNPLPIVSGPSNFCIGDTATLTPATSGWVSNSGIASIDNNGVVTANSSGTATFTFTDGNGCSSDFSLVINDLPIITNLPSGSTICVNESHSLSTSVNGTWNSSDNSIATISNTGDILGIAAGNVDFIFTDSNGCSGTTVSIEVQESPIITSISASESPVCAGDPSILSVDVPGSGTNIETLINYDFNSGNNYGALNGQEAPGITSTVYEGNNMPFSRQGGVATGGSAFTTNNTAGNALRQIDGAGDDEGYWVFDIEGSDLNTYEDFSLYFQTRRTNRRGSDKYIYIYYRVNNSGPFNYFSQVFINNNNAATNWTQVTAPVPALANNPSRLQIAVLVTDGRNSNNRRPNILIDNFQVQGTTVGSDYLYSWTSNTGADSGLPADAGTPLSTNDNITVNPEVTTEYDVTVTNSNGCSVTTQVTVDVFPSPEITVNADYCPIDDPSTSQDESNMVQLVASANVPISSWTWLTDPEQTGNTIYVDIADFYQVIGLTPDGCSESGTISVAQELVIDGDFTNVDIMDDSGYTFQSGHTFVPNQPGLVPANRGELWNDSGLLGYTITHRGDDVHRFFRGTDHTQNTVGPQNFMAVNGDSGIQVWSQNNTAIQPNTTYYFSAWVMRLVNGNPPQLVFNINGTQVGISITPPARSGPDNVNNNWVRFYGNWTSGPTENFADISIENLNPNQGGNDYGIDDISFGTLSTFIRLTSPDGTDSNQIICQNEPITNVTYDIGGGLDLPNIEWFLNGSTTSLGLNVFPDGLSATFNGLEYVISGSPEDYGVFDYTITTSSICDVKETNGVIVVNEAPVATIDAITTPICFSQGSIPLSVTLGGTATSGTWSSSGSGNFSNISSNGTSAIYNFGINDTGSVILSFTTNDPSGPCGAQTANVEVDITTYAIADAGNNIDNTLSSCEDVTVSLSANSSVGEWSVTSSQDPSTYFFSNASDSNSSFTGESGETYTLQWEAINTSPCSNTMDTITVTFANCGTNITFDGAEDYISFGNNYDLNINSFSLEAWIKADELSGSRTIFSKRSSDNSNTGYDLTLIGNRLFFRWDRNQVFATQTINNSKWYHVAVTFGRNAYNMYIDGFRVLTTTSGNAPSPNANKALIGAMDTSNDEPVNYFGGDIDEVRIWDVALSEGQIREMMNQEIEANGTNVRGVVVPLDISDNLQWRNLIGYYQMRFGPQAVVSNGTIQDISTSSPISGQLTKMTDVQEEAAPIPYVSNTDGVWDSESTWLNGSVQQIPNSKVNSINGFQQNWNIVRTATNVKTDRPSNTFNRTTVLGLLVDDNRLSIENDQHIIVDKYLIIDGTLDLVGESQLLQPMGSIVDYSGIGKLERSQQGTSNLYNYNYWSSPVSSDGNTYSIGSTLYDGSNLTNIQPLNWISGHDANPSTTPISITRRWLYLYENYPENTYADWRAINENTPINVGLGYTMKGSGSSSADQNYVFVGQPNNGLITTPVSGGFQALIGNPYPSAIDSETFINDNSSVLSDGALYFWEHAPSNSSHVLAAYEGGYAVRNLTNGIPAVSTPEINGTGNANKIPGRYVPVAQGFYVTGNATGGQITFNNNQRIFAKETNSTSLFLRSTNTEPENEVADASESNDQFIRLDFISPQNSIRHLLIGFMDNENATDGIDYGYDALNTESFPSDMSFNIEGQKFLIQGVNTFDVTKSYPLDIDLTTGGPIEIALDDLENFDEEIDVFIFDAEFGTYTRFNDVNFQMNLEAGSYSGRFSLVFQEDATLSTIQNEFENVTLRYLSDTNEIYLKTPASVEVKQLYLINVTGQTIASWNATNLPMSNEIKIPVRSISEGAYIVKAETDTGTFNRKLIVKYK